MLPLLLFWVIAQVCSLFERNTDRESDEDGRGRESSFCFGLGNKRLMEEGGRLYILFNILYILSLHIKDIYSNAY